MKEWGGREASGSRARFARLGSDPAKCTPQLSLPRQIMPGGGSAGGGRGGEKPPARCITARLCVQEAEPRSSPSPPGQPRSHKLCAGRARSISAGLGRARATRAWQSRALKVIRSELRFPAVTYA